MNKVVADLSMSNGKSLLKGIRYKINLKLLKTKTFDSGNVLLFYEPGKNMKE